MCVCERVTETERRKRRERGKERRSEDTLGLNLATYVLRNRVEESSAIWKFCLQLPPRCRSKRTGDPDTGNDV